MRSSWWPLLALALVAAPLLAVAQHQPEAAPDPSGYAVREEIATAGELSGAQRVLRFVQISDAHILDDDAPYPLRQEPLDDFGAPFTAAQRPQDEFTDEVLDSIIQAINAMHADDTFQFVMNTGDNIDNDLENELMRFIDVHDGTTTVTGPISGLPCQPDGQSTSVNDSSHDVADACTSLGEALAASHQGLATGLPWYSSFGNHDALIQGNANIEPSFQDLAADVGRRFLQQTEYVAMHFPGADSCTAVPAGTAADDFGHGYGFAGDRLCDADPDNDGYYAFELAGVRFLVLDTVNDDFVNGNQHLQGQFNPQTMTGSDIIGGYAEGSVDPDQLAWLRAEVAANPTKLLVVFSHHTVNSMFSSLAEGYCSAGFGCLDDLLTESGYATGPDLVEELSRSPNVAGWIGGHTHRHRIEPKTSGDGGFWNIESASLIDFPQEARVIELWVTANGTKGFWKLDDFGHAFQISKDLEETDSHRETVAAGGPQDQNTFLWFDIPAGVNLVPQPDTPRSLTIRYWNETHGAATGTVSIQMRDNVTLDGVDGLAVTASMVRSEACLDDAVHVLDPTAMQPAGNGTYAVDYSDPAGATYYVTVSANATPNYPAKTQVVSFALDGPPPQCKTSPPKGSPGLEIAVLGLALLVVALRRR